MDYLPPVVIEYVMTQADLEIERQLNAVINIPGVTFRRGRDEAGVDYSVNKHLTVGARYGDVAKTNTGDVHDQRWTVRVSVKF